MGDLSKGVFLLTCSVLLINSAYIEAASGHRPQLQILPTQAVQTKPIGKPLLLTCRPDVEDTSVITDLQWRDSLNRTILPKLSGSSRPPMYTEMMPGEMSLALFIPSLTEAMAGYYYCSASYAITERLDISVKIETILSITWIDAPEFQNPVYGTNYKVRCKVKAVPSPTVDWLRNGDPMTSSDRYLVDSNGLLINGVREEDDGVYTCRAAVIETGELQERNIKVEVHTPPKMLDMEKSLEVVNGESASVQCKATGKPLPTYTWIKQSTQQNLATADRFTVNQHTGLLTFNKVEHNDFGDYICEARNPAGHANAVVSVEVIVKPKIVEYYNISAPVDKETRLVCKATGRPAPFVTFKKVGTDKKFVPGAQIDDDRIILEQESNKDIGHTIGTLTITTLVRADDGLYECIASNKGDTYYKKGHLTVEFAPSFKSSENQPPVFTWNHNVANLSCLAESIPNATIEWRLNDRLINDRNIDIVGTGPQSNLIIRPLDRRYYTQYKCIASNKHGRAEHFVQLKEAFPPAEIIQAKIEVITATTITFSIVGPSSDHNDYRYGLPILAYTVQYKDERNMDWNTAMNRTWSVDSPYILEGLQPQAIYNFRFAARNAVGLGKWAGNIRQAMPQRSVPEDPKFLKSSTEIEGVSMSPYADHFELRWKVPADNGEPIDVYQIKYCPVQKVNGEWNEFDNLCKEEEMRAFQTTSYEMNDLTSNTYYRVEVRAHNGIGYSEPAQLVVKTAQGSDNIIRSEGPLVRLSSAAIIGIVIGSVLLLLVAVDLCCYCVARVGLLATLCHAHDKHLSTDDEEAKLGRDETEPLQVERTPVIDTSVKRNTSVEFDGKKAYAKTGEIIGKNSAV